jgi:cell pole-organizing protein PopZ
VTVRCDELSRRLPDYLEDALPAEDVRSFRDHLSSCDACRNEVAVAEPSLLFARARPEEVSSEDVARVLAGVRTAIALRETEAKLGAARSRRRRRLAAMASAAVVAAMTLVLPGSGRRSADSVTAAAPAGPVAEPGFSPAAQHEPSGTFPADTTIYDWNPGAESPELRVVWIVDRSLDI